MDETTFTADLWNQPAGYAAPAVDARTVRAAAEILRIDVRNAEAVVVHAARLGTPLPYPQRTGSGSWELSFRDACERAFNAWAATAV